MLEHPSHFLTFVVAFDRTYACIMEDTSSLLLSYYKCNLALSYLQSIQQITNLKQIKYTTNKVSIDFVSSNKTEIYIKQ